MYSTSYYNKSKKTVNIVNEATDFIREKINKNNIDGLHH